MALRGEFVTFGLAMESWGLRERKDGSIWE